jgi:hypothetical protein
MVAKGWTDSNAGLDAVNVESRSNEGVCEGMGWLATADVRLRPNAEPMNSRCDIQSLGV